MKVKPQRRRPFLNWTTVHKDVTERLRFIDPDLYERVKKVLEFNLSERHLRGGDATRRKYELRGKKN